MSDYEFSDWLNEVNDAVVQLTGLSYEDFPDAPIRDWFDDGVEPDEAARMIINEDW